MIDRIALKICGLTSVRDAHLAVEAGADYLGFIFHPASPRVVTLDHYRALAPELPSAKRVAVIVEPTPETLAGLRDAGFDFFQVYVRHGAPDAQLAEWSRLVTPERLWLAPRLPPAAAFPPRLLPQASTFLLDTFDTEKFGGTGRTGDWGKFARTQQAHRAKTWVLSGGLSPENIAEALRETGATFIDVNSGVESAPGVKDRARIAALVAALRSSPLPEARR